MTLRHLFIAALLPAAFASSFLVGYSTGGHFACQGTSCPDAAAVLPQSALPSLLDRLATPTSASDADLPVSSSLSSQQVPELTLVVRSSFPSAPRAVLERLSSAAEGAEPTSFVARAALPEQEGTWSVARLEQLIASDGVAMFADGKPDVVSVSVAAGEVDRLMQSVRSLSRRVKGQLAVLWVGREDAAAEGGAAPADGDAAPAEGGEAPAEADTAPAAGGDAASAGDAGKEPPKEAPKEAENPNPSGMRRPEISEAGVAGLLVGLVFLLIFVPGFMCLWRIQPPETFEMIDSNDMKKKMQ